MKIFLFALTAFVLAASSAAAQAQTYGYPYPIYNQGSPFGTPGNGSPNNVDGGR